MAQLVSADGEIFDGFGEPNTDVGKGHEKKEVATLAKESAEKETAAVQVRAEKEATEKDTTATAQAEPDKEAEEKETGHTDKRPITKEASAETLALVALGLTRAEAEQEVEGKGAAAAHTRTGTEAPETAAGQAQNVVAKEAVKAKVRADAEAAAAKEAADAQTKADEEAAAAKETTDAQAKAVEETAAAKEAADAQTKADEDAAAAKEAADAQAKADEESASTKEAADTQAKSDEDAAAAKESEVVVAQQQAGKEPVEKEVAAEIMALVALGLTQADAEKEVVEKDAAATQHAQVGSVAQTQADKEANKKEIAAAQTQAGTEVAEKDGAQAQTGKGAVEKETAANAQPAELLSEVDGASNAEQDMAKLDEENARLQTKVKQLELTQERNRVRKLEEENKAMQEKIATMSKAKTSSRIADAGGALDEDERDEGGGFGFGHDEASDPQATKSPAAATTQLLDAGNIPDSDAQGGDKVDPGNDALEAAGEIFDGFGDTAGTDHGMIDTAANASSEEISEFGFGDGPKCAYLSTSGSCENSRISNSVYCTAHTCPQCQEEKTSGDDCCDDCTDNVPRVMPEAVSEDVDQANTEHLVVGATTDDADEAEDPKGGLKERPAYADGTNSSNKTKDSSAKQSKTKDGSTKQRVTERSTKKKASKVPTHNEPGGITKKKSNTRGSTKTGDTATSAPALGAGVDIEQGCTSVPGISSSDIGKPCIVDIAEDAEEPIVRKQSYHKDDSVVCHLWCIGYPVATY